MKVSEIKIHPIYKGDEARVNFLVGDAIGLDFEPVIAAYIGHQLLKAANYFDDRLPVLPDDVTFNLVEEDHDFRTCPCESCTSIRERIKRDGGPVHNYP